MSKERKTERAGDKDAVASTQPASRLRPDSDAITQVQRFRTSGSVRPSEVMAALERRKTTLDMAEESGGAAPAETAAARARGDDEEPQPLKVADQGTSPLSVLDDDDAIDDPIAQPGRYQVVDKLGSGAMGEVLRVRDTWIDRDVAMKTLHPDKRASEEHLKALHREARIIGRLEHPSIVPVHAVGKREDGAAFYTMKLVSHMSLRDVIDRLQFGDQESSEKFPLRRLVDIFVRIAQGLEYAHSKGVVHRDLKPENVLLGEFGEVQIMDWGVAKRMVKEAVVDAEGVVVGTPAYMSPEQASGEDSRVDHRSDIYSLGVMLYEVLALRRPYASSNQQQQIEVIKNITPLPPSVVARDREVPSELDELTMSMLAKRGERRPQSMRVVWQTLESYLAGEQERERQLARAKQWIERADVELKKYRQMQREREFLAQELDYLRRIIRPWDDQSEKQRLWQQRHRLQRLDVLVAHSFGVATELLRNAVDAVDLPSAREALIELYWERHDGAEAAEDSATKLFFARLAHELESPGDERLSGHLHIRSSPPGAVVYAVPFHQYDQQMGSPTAQYEIGITPITACELPVGPYVIIARLDGHRDAQEACYVRNQHQDMLLLFDAWARDLPLVGRSVELAALWSIADDMEICSKPLTCLISGAPGTGRNRLLDAFRSQVKEHPHKLYMLLEVTCEPLRRDLPYAVVVDMIRLRAAVMQSDSAATVRQKLHRMVTLAYSRFGRRELDDSDALEALKVADTIAALPAFDLDDPVRSGLHDDLTEDARSALTWALATYFQRLAVSSPLQILVRDAEFMDHASRMFFAELLNSVRGAPILVIATASTQPADPLPVSLRRGPGSPMELPFHFDKHIRLEPLSELALQQLARELLGAPIHDKLLTWLSEHAQGNPFLAAELIAALAHRGAIVSENAEWRLVRSKLPDLSPGDLESAVRAWLLTLPEATLKVLSKAVVVGRVFWTGTLEALGAESIDSALEVLLERGLICRNATSRYVHEQEYALTSALRWRVAYDMLAPRQRRQHHRKVAAWLASQGRTDMEEALVMAHHLELGGQPGEAALLLLGTAHAARRAGARQDAIRLYTHAHVLGDDPSVQESAERALEALQTRSV